MKKSGEKKSFWSRVWTWTKRIFLFLLISHLVYIVALKWIDPPITITQFSNWITGNGLKRDYVDAQDIADDMRLAVIASEDQLFPDHEGFDWKSIERAQKYNARKPGRTMRGGSSISQQVAKNVFLWQGRTKFRKALEAYFTMMIELIWGKERILEVYLNVIEMGKGIFGVEAAAKAYFGKPAKSLTRNECAMIAACLPNPKIYTVKPPAPYIRVRSPQILRQMANLSADPDIHALVVMEKKEEPVKKKGK